MGQGRFRRLFTRRRVKRVGLVLCVLVLGVYVASAWIVTDSGWRISKPNQLVFVGIFEGRLGFGVWNFKLGPVPIPRRKASFHIRPTVYPAIDLRPVWLDQRTFNVPGSPSTATRVFLALWIPLLLIAAPTAWLWRTDQRAKPWQCPKCRYDLRGLDGGVCPECGHELKPSNAEGVAD